MLLGPAMDTFEARADCRANKLTLTRERERTVRDRPCTSILSFHFASREDLSKMRMRIEISVANEFTFFENL